MYMFVLSTHINRLKQLEDRAFKCPYIIIWWLFEILESRNIKFTIDYTSVYKYNWV